MTSSHIYSNLVVIVMHCVVSIAGDQSCRMIIIALHTQQSEDMPEAAEDLRPTCIDEHPKACNC